MDTLITKLKGAADNSGLTRLGCLRINVYSEENPASSHRGIKVNVSAVTTIKSYGGHIAHTYADLTDNPQTELTIPKNTDYDIFFENADFYAEIDNKYALQRYRVQSVSVNSCIGIDLDSLAYCDLLETLYITGPYIQGHIESLPVKSSSTTFYFSISGCEIESDISKLTGKITAAGSNVAISDCPNLYGDIGGVTFAPGLATLTLTRSNKITGTMAEMGVIGALTTLNLNETISGEIEDFVRARRERGESSGSVALRTGFASLVTFNGIIQANVNSTLSWTSSTMTYNGVTIDE